MVVAAPPQEQSLVNGRSARDSVVRAGEIVKRYGLTDAAYHAVGLMDAEFRTGTVVVVGEIKRGKSSLVNALVGHRDLLPVDVLMCTSAPIRVSTEPDREPSAAPEFKLVRGNRRDAVSREELPRWITHQAAQEWDRRGAQEEGALELPSAAEIEVSFKPLNRVTVIDTPGVGGLDEHAIHAALQEARNAGVLLMVCDASTPITAPEMEVLRQARETVGSVIVAVTKIDKNIRRWRSIVDDDRRLITKHLGIEIPVIGVSSLRALDALDLTDPKRRQAVEERSGMAELRREINRALSNTSNLGVRTAIESMQISLRGLTKDIQQDIKLHQGSSDAVMELEAERAKVEQFREEASEWEQFFQRDISIARNEITARLDQRLEDARQEWTNRINSDGLRVLRTKAQVFTSQMEVEFQTIMESTIAEMMQRLEEQAQRLFPDKPELTNEVMQEIMLSLVPEAKQQRDVEKKTKDIFDPSVVMMGMVGAGVLTAIIPIAPLAGGAWIGINMAYRAMRNGKNHLITWLRETIQSVRMSTTRMLDTLITTARTEILLKYRSNLRTEQKRLQDKVEQVRKIAQESEAERKNKIQRFEKNLQIINTTIEELEQHKSAMTHGAAPQSATMPSATMQNAQTHGGVRA